jgi:hypothetical protein
MNKNKRIALIVIICIVIVAIILYYINKKSKDIFSDYEGDNYEGQPNYVGDKDFYENDEGRKNAVAEPSTLYKLSDDAHKLKHEFNKFGKKTFIKTGGRMRKGAQVRVLDNSFQSPVKMNNREFVQTIFGNWIRKDKLIKIR